MAKTNLASMLQQAGQHPETIKALYIMYLMYVDESGDCGMDEDGSPTRYFCLTGLVVHELRWRDTMAELLSFRHWLKRKYKVYLEDELHAADMIARPKKAAASLQCLHKYERLAIVRNFADKIATLADVSLINVVVDKQAGHVPNKDEVFRWAWYTLFQRFENTINRQNFPGPRNAIERGMVFPDNTDGMKLRKYLASMRLRNPIRVRLRDGAFCDRDEPIRVIIEDPVLRDSKESYFIQAADCAVYLLKQSIEPSSYMKKHGGSAYFTRLEPVLCKHATNKHQMGVVWL